MNAPETPPSRGPGTAAGSWAVLGVSLLFLEATFNLGRRGVQAMRSGLEPWEWLALALLTIAFVYGEGVRALQRRWVPRVVQRAAAVRHERSRMLRVLAPLYALSLLGAPRRSMLRAWLGVLAIVAAVLVVRNLPSPWRGIIDFAVAAALAWGLAALLTSAWRALR